MPMSRGLSSEVETAGAAPDAPGSRSNWQAFVSILLALVRGDQLSAIQRNVVEAVRCATSARYVAFGVVGEDGRLNDFVHSGDATRSRVATDIATRHGGAPQGWDSIESVLAGILGFDPNAETHAHLGLTPIRSTDPALFAVPVSVDGRACGVIYLADGPDDGFTSEEEDLVIGLAGIAGTAIRRAQLGPASQRRENCNATSLNVLSAAMDRPAQALNLVARGARQCTGASFAAVEVPIGDEAVMLAASDGMKHRDTAGRVLPLRDAPLYRRVAQTQRPISIPDATTNELRQGSAALTGQDVGPVLAVPLIAASRCVGMLALANPPGFDRFTPLDVEMATSFAAHAALAVQSTAATQRERRLVRLEDRDRLAREMNDGAIQLLFSCGLQLESLMPSMDNDAAMKLAGALENMDQAIDAIRRAIHSPHEPDLHDVPLRVKLAQIMIDAREMLGFDPILQADAFLDDVVPWHAHSHVLAVVQEAVLSIARAAGASQARIVVAVQSDDVTVEISDDGNEASQRRQDRGLRILRSLAAHLGGHMYTAPGIDGAGLRMTWSMPLRP
jgi:GAF domain-containing protein